MGLCNNAKRRWLQSTVTELVRHVKRTCLDISSSAEPVAVKPVAKFAATSRQNGHSCVFFHENIALYGLAASTALWRYAEWRSRRSANSSKPPLSQHSGGRWHAPLTTASRPRTSTPPTSSMSPTGTLSIPPASTRGQPYGPGVPRT